jgi:hypothetical protein
MRNIKLTCAAIVLVTVSSEAMAQSRPLCCWPSEFHKTPVEVMLFPELIIRLRHLAPSLMKLRGGRYDDDGSTPRGTRTEEATAPPISCPTLGRYGHQYHSDCLVVACSLPRMTMP